MVTKKPKGLGRGLEALLGPKLDDSTSLDAAGAELGQPEVPERVGVPALALVDDAKQQVVVGIGHGQEGLLRVERQ